MSQDPLLGRDLRGFRIEALVGRGGMGRVYRARQESLDRTVALKILSDDLYANAEFRARFLAESRTAAKLEHPNILPVYDAGEADGYLYIAMRYVEGTDLHTLIQRDGALAPERASWIVGQVAAALDAAHRAGVIHRDVKPSNVLIADEQVYLADFGIAKTVAGRRELTRTGAFVGTVDYAAPEQIRNDTIDGAADLYSLGCVLFECLTGRIPFNSPSDFGVMQAHLSEPPPRPSAMALDLPPALDVVIARALSKEKGDRYPTGRALGDAIAAALAHVTRATAARTVLELPTPTVHVLRAPSRAGAGRVALLIAGLVGVVALVAFGASVVVAPGATTATVRVTAPPATASPTPVLSAVASSPLGAVPSAAATPSPSPASLTSPTAAPTSAPARPTATNTSRPRPTAARTPAPVLAVLSGLTIAANGGTRAPGVVVRAWAGTVLPSEVAGSTTSDGSGSFAISLPPGRYWVSFVPPRGSGHAVTWYRRALWAGATSPVVVEADGLSISAHLLRARTVAGKVLDAETRDPVPQARLLASLASAPLAGAFGSATTDAQGQFVMELPEGEYTLTLSSASGAFPAQQWSRTVVVADNIRGLEVRIDK